LRPAALLAALFLPIFSEAFAPSLSLPLQASAKASFSGVGSRLPPPLTMSLFPDGSGVSGAIERATNTIRVNLPSELDNTDPFVLDTMTNRVPTKIIGRTVDYNKPDLDQEALEGMEAVAEEMRGNKPIKALTKGPNMEHWNRCLKPYLDKGTTWGDLPWYVGETYVYHRLLESSGYWDEGSKGFGLDIFAREKAEALELAFPQVEARAAIAGEAKGKWDAQSCRAMLLMSLWGNQGDSSLFTIQDMAAMGGEAKSDERIIVDDVDDAWNHLCRGVSSGKGLDVHFLNDNAGLELASDLFLSHYLLSTGKVSSVTLHLKPYPFFVSDAMTSDIESTLERFSASPSTAPFAAELRDHIERGTLKLEMAGPLNAFLASPEPMWCMDAPSRDALSSSSLTIAKGDLMYRKLLGDRTFEPMEEFGDITSYFPSPLLALRTCKSPVAIGMSQSKANDLDKSHPTWMVDGQLGMVQFGIPPPGASTLVTNDYFEVEYDGAKIDAELQKFAE